MKRAIYREFGHPAEVLELVEEDSPALNPGQARIEVLRSPINPSDYIQVAGEYGVRPPLPATAGNEGIGRVTEVNGEGISVGQLVLLPIGEGAWRTEVVGEIRHLVPMPEGDLDQLSMLMVNPATAQLLLTQFVDLKEGDWIIQSAANSAVGTYVVQLAKAKGINVCCVVRRQSAVPALEEAGAAAVIVDSPTLAKDVRQATDAKMKLALDAVAGETFGRLAETLEEGGTLVNYGAMSRESAQITAGTLIFGDITVKGFWLVHWFSKASTEERMQTYGALTQAVAAGTLHAPIDKVFPLDEITEAVRYTMAGERTGKVLVAPNGI
ncbi:zinc-dependent alcohol dehydrogenase family protein [Aestuariivita sp.]|uniref:zinc-dependent alcohol dehydrogenase family protein n=1 Tax=Aestuariivita sp. TaxID=1872407 RepID=UPI002170D4F0|nr:zinc-dependent alcohol dehydrogenase family protein [Aestuariivita sp.]MCE8007197.1 zinc-dependent alcohol dehydrogenase family protein [Aestuariivita sp.]